MLGSALRGAGYRAARRVPAAPAGRCRRLVSSSSSSSSAAAAASAAELDINWERDIGRHFQPQSRRIQRGGPFPRSDRFFKKTRLRVSNLASGVTEQQLHQLFASIDPAESRDVGETQIHVGELDEEGGRWVTLPEDLCHWAVYLSGTELEGEPIVVEATPGSQAALGSGGAAYGWEWSALGSGDDGHDNAAWLAGNGPRRALSSARYWGVVPDLLPHPPKLEVHLACTWAQQVHRGGKSGAFAAFRGNTVSAEMLSSGAPMLHWPVDGAETQAQGGFTLIMSVLPPAAEGPEVASVLASYEEPAVAAAAGSVWHGWVLANMGADSGAVAEGAVGSGDLIMPYQLSPSGEEGAEEGEGGVHPLLRPGARVAFALYAQPAAIGGGAPIDLHLYYTPRIQTLETDNKTEPPLPLH